MSRGSSQTSFMTPGTLLRGRYRLQRVIGRGRTAIVFAADDEWRGAGVAAARALAVKILRAEHANDDAERDALQIEGETQRALRHPYIPRLVEADMAREIPFLVMEMVPGPDLDRGDWQRPMSAIDIGRLLGGAAEALAFMHRRGFVHADVKPGNLRCGDDGVARLIDFGTARPAGQRPALHGRRAGAAPDRILTPAYASPQLMQGMPPTPADDIYGLAVVAYQLAAGQHPYAARAPLPGDILLRPEGLGPSGWNWLRDALAVDRTERPSDPRGLAAALLADFPMVRLLRRLSPWRD